MGSSLSGPQPVKKRSMVKFVKVQWSNHSEDEATWEREDRLHQEYPEFFSDE